ncbi:MAG: hypothetical protein U0V56_10890 [Actinomycetota bacterium]
MLIVVLPNPKGGERTASGTSQAAADMGGAESAPQVAAASIEVRDVDYTAADLGALIAPYRRDAVAGAGSSSGRPGTEADTRRALECLQAAAPDAPGDLTQLIEARFQGRPAYFGIYVEGPGVGQPPDKATVWVVSRRDCAILSFAQAKL